MIALIDGDILVYLGGFSTEHTYYDVFHKDEHILTFDYYDQLWEWIPWCDDLDNIRVESRREAQPLSFCLHSVKELIQSIQADTQATDIRIFISGKNNFREKIATIAPYKGNRDKAHKPKYYDQIKSYLVSRYGAMIVDDQEADDALGIEQTRLKKLGIPSVICSKDKDLLQIPGKHYHISKRTFTDVSEEEGIRFFFTQLLTGDSVDNIKGCPGVGPVKAKEILDGKNTPKEMFYACLEAYSKKYDNPMEALIENGRLLWIRRHEGEDWADEAIKCQAEG